jgi:hypothetical protein
MAWRSSGFSYGIPCLERAFFSISVRLLYGTGLSQQVTIPPIYFIDSLVITLLSRTTNTCHHYSYEPQIPPTSTLGLPRGKQIASQSFFLEDLLVSPVGSLD